MCYKSELAASIRCRGHLLLTTASQIGAQCIREVAIPQDLMAATERPKVGFLAYECPGYLGIGGKVWDSTYVLFKYLQRNPELIRQKSVFEFGSGTGLAGRHIAK